jgi:hypothetical protein
MPAANCRHRPQETQLVSSRRSRLSRNATLRSASLKSGRPSFERGGSPRTVLSPKRPETARVIFIDYNGEEPGVRLRKGPVDAG